jgi:hypothetical protein
MSLLEQSSNTRNHSLPFMIGSPIRHIIETITHRIHRINRHHRTISLNGWSFISLANCLLNDPIDRLDDMSHYAFTESHCERRNTSKASSSVLPEQNRMP